MYCQHYGVYRGILLPSIVTMAKSIKSEQRIMTQYTTIIKSGTEYAITKVLTPMKNRPNPGIRLFFAMSVPVKNDIRDDYCSQCKCPLLK